MLSGPDASERRPRVAATEIRKERSCWNCDGDACCHRDHVPPTRSPPTQPEADGTIAWDSTTLVLVEADGRRAKGIGYTYADAATAHLIDEMLADVVRAAMPLERARRLGRDGACDRNLGRPGICSMAISAVDVRLVGS